MQACFISGVQRSGTTLLAVMLGNHPAVYVERRAITFRLITAFNNAFDLMSHNLDLDEDSFYQWLVDSDKDHRLAELLLPIQANETIQALIHRSLKDKTEKEGASIWIDKAPNLQHYIPELLRLVPSAKVIHIVRDGRATAYSMATRTPKHLALSAQAWVDGTIQALVNQRMVGVDQFLIIQYEDLLRNPEEQLRAVCTFLNIPFDKRALQTTDTTSDESSYVNDALDKSKIDRWRNQLSTKNLRQIESIQGALLDRLGYEVVHEEYRQSQKVLSLRKRILYSEVDNFKQLFASKRIGMKDRKMIEIKRPIRSRVYLFAQTIVGDFFSRPIFKSLFSRIFYKQKRYTRPPNDNPTSNQ